MYNDTGVCENTHSSGEEYALEYWFSEHQIRAWIAVSAVRLQGEGLRKRIVSFHGHRQGTAFRACSSNALSSFGAGAVTRVTWKISS